MSLQEILVVFMIAMICIYVLYVIDKHRDYKKARNTIFAFVKGYKRQCTGNNRFVVTPSILQDSFRDYDIITIEKVWLELINEKIIQQDVMDNEWCIR